MNSNKYELLEVGLSRKLLVVQLELVPIEYKIEVVGPMALVLIEPSKLEKF